MNGANVMRALACAGALLAAAGASAQADSGGPPPADVRVGPVQVRTVQEQRMVTGDVRALRRSAVAALEAGRVLTFPVLEGEVVEAGAPLATLDSRRLEIQRRQAGAEHAAAEALLVERRATLAQRERDLELIRTSFERGAANSREVLDAESALAVAEAQVQAAAQQIALAAARLDLLDERLSDMTVVAPFSGVVIARRTEVGQWIGEGDPVVELLAVDPVEVWLDVPQRYYRAVADHADTVSVDVAATDAQYTVTGTRIIAQVDPTARTFSLVLTIDNEHRDLAPGMSVVAYVPTGAETQGLTVPKNAVLRNDAGPYLYVLRRLSDEGPPSAAPVIVDLLFPLGDRYVIRATGLNDGDLVVTEGNERLFPMSPVRPVETAETPEPGAVPAAPDDEPRVEAPPAEPAQDDVEQLGAAR